MSGLRGAVMLLAVCLAGPSAGAGEDLVHNGDFELPATKGPPPGWALWGASKYKVPANFTRDTANPHGGKACFRIHHPANTAGYVVTDPGHAIRAKKGMAYRVSFWARSDTSAPAVFYIEGYESLRPYKDAPSPGRWPVRVSAEWRPFAFEFREGRDFLADRTRFLLLAFRATLDKSAAKTLWIDDVVVTARESAAAAGFVDESKLAVATLEHRLRPGRELALVLDTAKRIGPATRMAGGVSFHRVAGWGRHPFDRSGKYVLESSLERAVREMRLPMSRLYAVGDEPFGLTGSLDRAAEICKRMGIRPETMVLELETQSATSKLAPAVWARAAAYARRRGYGFRTWEISNEPYTRKATAFDSPEDYVAHFKAVAAAIRKAQPSARIGIPIHAGSRSWCHVPLKDAAGGYDFVVGHYYCNADAYKLPLEDVVLTANYRTLREVLRINALIRAYNPDRDVYQLDTEWGLASNSPAGKGPEYAPRNANIVGTLHRAVRLIYYAREGMLRGASGWEMFCRLKGPGFGILSRDAPERGLMLYWLYHHFNRHVGAWALSLEGEAPWHTPADKTLAGPLTPVLATASEDGRTVYLVIANGSMKQPVPCRVTFRRFRPATAAGVTLSQSDLDADPLVKRPEDAITKLPIRLGPDGKAAMMIPPHAVVFVTLTEGS